MMTHYEALLAVRSNILKEIDIYELLQDKRAESDTLKDILKDKYHQYSKLTLQMAEVRQPIEDFLPEDEEVLAVGAFNYR